MTRVKLPSRGVPYPVDHPFSDGYSKIRHMTAADEDMLTDKNQQHNGSHLYDLYESVLLDDCNSDQILVADKDAILLASRMLAYGSQYPVEVSSPSLIDEKEKFTLDLGKIDEGEIDWGALQQGQRQFNYVLPTSGIEVVWEFLTVGREKQLFIKNDSPSKSDHLKARIHSVNGNADRKYISNSIDNMLVKDITALRNDMSNKTPFLDTKYEELTSTGELINLEVSIDSNFFNLPPDYAKHLRQQIMDLVYHTSGGFGWEEIYCKMSVSDRRMLIRNLKDMKKKEQKQMEKAKSGQQNYGAGSGDVPDAVQNLAKNLPNTQPPKPKSPKAPKPSKPPTAPDPSQMAKGTGGNIDNNLQNKFKQLLDRAKDSTDSTDISEAFKRRFKNE